MEGCQAVGCESELSTAPAPPAVAWGSFRLRAGPAWPRSRTHLGSVTSTRAGRCPAGRAQPPRPPGPTCPPYTSWSLCSLSLGSLSESLSRLPPCVAVIKARILDEAATSVCARTGSHRAPARQLFLRTAGPGGRCGHHSPRPAALRSGCSPEDLPNSLA